MAKLSIVAGATSQSINVFLQDSTSTTGAGKTGLVFNTSGLTAYYAFPKTASVQITLATLAAITTAYSSGGFKEVDSTNMPGWYRLDLPNAMIASGNGRYVTLHIRGATGLADCAVEIELTGWDNQDAVHGGLSCLPNVASGSAGALPTTGTGANQINVDGAGNVNANVNKWLAGTIPAPNVTGVPKVDLVDWLGSVPNSLNAGRVDAVASIRSGTAQAGAASTITLDAGASATNNIYQDCMVLITGGTGANQVRAIQSYVGSTKVATIFPNWTTNPDNTSTFTVIPLSQVDVGNWTNQTIPATNVAGVPLVDAKYLLGTIFATPATAGILDVNVKNIVNQAAQIDGNNLLKVDLVDIAGAAVATGTAQLGVNVVNIAGQAATLDGNNYLKVDVVDIAGAAVSTSSAQIGVNVVNLAGSASAGAAGYVALDMAQALPSNPTANAVGEALFFADLLGGRVNTAQAGTSTTITLDAGASADTNAYIGDDIFLYGGTGGGIRGTGQRRTIVAYNTSTKVATVNRAWDTTPDNTTKFITFPQALANVGLWSNGLVPSPNVTGVPKVDLIDWLGVTPNALAAGNVQVTVGHATLDGPVRQQNSSTYPIPFLCNPPGGAGTAVGLTPDVIISGNGSGARAHAVTNGQGGVLAIIIDAPGSGYSGTPTATVQGGAGSGTTLGTPTISGTGIATVPISAAGTGQGPMVSLSLNSGPWTNPNSQVAEINIGPPAFPSTVFTGPSSTGGNLAQSTTYYYKVTATNALGETTASIEQSYLVPTSGTSTNQITLNWTAVTGATGYKVYRSTSSGSELLLATVSGGGTTSYADTTGTTPAGALPTLNTTGAGWYALTGSGLATDLASVGTLLIRATSGGQPADTSIEVVAYRTGYGLRTGLAQSATSSTITLDAGASATTDYYKDLWILIQSGTGAGQTRQFTAYNSSTKVGTVAPNWATTPDNTSVFVILPAAGVDLQLWEGVAPNPLLSGRVDSDSWNVALPGSYAANTAGWLIGTYLTAGEFDVVHAGAAQAGASNTITLASSASATTDTYKGLLIYLYSGTGAGQVRAITAYNGATKVATIDFNWITQPISGTLYAVRVADASILNDPWQASLPGAYSVGTAGYIVGQNLNATVSSRATPSQILLTPSNLLATDSLGRVLVQPGTGTGQINLSSGNVTIAGYATGQDPATLLLVTPANKLTTDASGRVDLSKVLGATINALVSGRVDASMGAVASAVISNAAFVAGAVDSNAFAQSAADKVWTSGLTVVNTGTAQGGAAGSITLAVSASTTTDLYKGAKVRITSGTGSGQARTITGYSSGRVASVDWNWTVAPDATSVYSVSYDDASSLNSSLQVSTTASDPWATALPGAYGIGTAGNLVGNGLGSSGVIVANYAAGKDPASYVLATPANKLTTDASGRIQVQSGSGAGQVNLTSGNVTVAGYIGGQDPASYLLSNTSNKLLTDANGRIQVQPGTATGQVNLAAGNVTVAGYATGQDPPTLLFVNPANKLLTDSSGKVTPTPIESSVLQSGTAQAGGASTLTLAAGATATSGLYNGCRLKLYGGTGSGQSRTILSYNGATKVATVDYAWTTQPDNTTTYAVVEADNPALNSSLQVTSTATDPWATSLPGAYAVGTAGNILGNRLDATVSSRATVAQILVNTSNPLATDASGRVQVQPGTATGQVNLSGGNVTIGGYATGQDPPTLLLVNPANKLLIDGNGRVQVQPGTGTGQINLNAGNVTVFSNTDKTGYSLAITPPTAVQVATQVWQDLTGGTDFSTGGSIGALLAANINATISSRSTYAGTDTPGVTTLLTRLPSALTITSGGVTIAGYAAGQDPATLVLDVAASAHNTASTIGARINSIATIADPWATSLPGAYGAGTAGNILGNIPSYPAHFSALAITAGGGVTVATNGDKTGYALTTGEHTAIAGDIWNAQRSSYTTAGTFGQGVASVQGSVASIAGVTFPANLGVLAIDSNGRIQIQPGTATGQVSLSSGNVTIAGYAAGQDPATLVLDVLAANHNAAGSVGAKIVAAGSAADPWATSLPGAYGAGTAGFLLGTNLDAKISTRLPSGGSVVVSGYAAGQDPASLILATPANKLAIDTSGRVTVISNQDKQGYSLAATGLNSIICDGSFTPVQVLNLIAAAVAGLSTGAGTGTENYFGVGGGALRFTVTIDQFGNRTGFTYP
jgi:hypothetical protein